MGSGLGRDMALSEQGKQGSDHATKNASKRSENSGRHGNLLQIGCVLTVFVIEIGGDNVGVCVPAYTDFVRCVIDQPVAGNNDAVDVATQSGLGFRATRRELDGDHGLFSG